MENVVVCDWRNVESRRGLVVVVVVVEGAGGILEVGKVIVDAEGSRRRVFVALVQCTRNGMQISPVTGVRMYYLDRPL